MAFSSGQDRSIWTSERGPFTSSSATGIQEMFGTEQSGNNA